LEGEASAFGAASAKGRGGRLVKQSWRFETKQQTSMPGRRGEHAGGIATGIRDSTEHLQPALMC
jgi:hypothetical protein